MERAVDTKKITEQYRGVVGLLDAMFREIGLRSEAELWRFDGVGNCSYVTKVSSEIGLESPARRRLIRLRQKRNKDIGGKSTIAKCPYHRAGMGCVLGDLKAPICIAHVDYPGTLQRKFKVDGYQLKQDIDWILECILGQEVSDNESELFDCMNVGEFNELAQEAIRKMSGHIKLFPLLERDDSYLLNGHYRGSRR